MIEKSNILLPLSLSAFCNEKIAEEAAQKKWGRAAEQRGQFQFAFFFFGEKNSEPCLKTAQAARGIVPILLSELYVLIVLGALSSKVHMNGPHSAAVCSIAISVKLI